MWLCVVTLTAANNEFNSTFSLAFSHVQHENSQQQHQQMISNTAELVESSSITWWVKRHTAPVFSLYFIPVYSLIVEAFSRPAFMTSTEHIKATNVRAIANGSEYFSAILSASAVLCWSYFLSIKLARRRTQARCGALRAAQQWEWESSIVEGTIVKEARKLVQVLGVLQHNI